MPTFQKMLDFAIYFALAALLTFLSKMEAASIYVQMKIQNLRANLDDTFM